MASVHELDAQKRTEFQHRLRRIEGQAKGVQRMIDDGRDCLEIAEQFLTDQNWADACTLSRWRTEALDQVDEAVAIVQREPAPDPYQEKWAALSSTRFVEPAQEDVE